MRFARIVALLLLAACTDGIVLPRVNAPPARSRTVAASPAKLVLNELMPDPTLVSDANGEWFEVMNAGGTDADLLNYYIGSANDPGATIVSSVIVPAGGYVVLGRNADISTNGGVAVAYSYGTAITLANAGDWLTLKDPGGVTVDSVRYTSSRPGKSWSLKDPLAEHSTIGEPIWQLATSLYNSADFGTPNAQNDGYVLPPPPVGSVVVTPASASIAVGITAQLTAQEYDAAGLPVATTFTWTSLDPTVATVSDAGLVTGIAAGATTITATAVSGIAGTASVTVTSAGTVEELIVRVLDVGQGDANYIENGTTKIIIDGGPSMPRFGALLDSLGLNTTTINAVILSHQHYDHHSGLRELFRTSRNITINYFFENQDVYANAALQELRDSIGARVGRGQLIYRNTDDPCANGSPICTIFMAGGAKLEILRPNPVGSTPNNRSTAAKLVGPDSASFTMWFAGDAEREEIAWFLGAAGYNVTPGMQVNVLKSDHHGSCNGVTNAYAGAVNPDLETMSVGATNTYGHIHQQTKDLWLARIKPWYRTDQNGTITFRTPGTVAGGYTVTVGAGVASMDGATDRASSQAQCNPIP